MKAFQRDPWRRDHVASVKRETIAKAVVSVAEHGASGYDGELERMRGRIDALTELVGRLTEELQYVLGPDKLANVLQNNYEVERE